FTRIYPIFTRNLITSSLFVHGSREGFDTNLHPQDLFDHLSRFVERKKDLTNENSVCYPTRERAKNPLPDCPRFYLYLLPFYQSDRDLWFTLRNLDTLEDQQESAR